MRRLNIYKSERTDRASSQLVHEPWLWDKVATVRMGANQSIARVCFAHPSPKHAWIDRAACATDDQLSGDRLEAATEEGLPIRASCLIFEYTDLHIMGRYCAQCHNLTPQGNTCFSCHANVNECFRCSSIDFSSGEGSFLCTNCGSSPHAKLEFTVIAR